MIAVLTTNEKPMSLLEIVEQIKHLDSAVFNGKTPRNSLYSIIYKREKKREENGEKTLFKAIKIRRDVLYSLNT